MVAVIVKDISLDLFLSWVYLNAMQLTRNKKLFSILVVETPISRFCVITVYLDLIYVRIRAKISAMQ